MFTKHYLDMANPAVISKLDSLGGGNILFREKQKDFKLKNTRYDFALRMSFWGMRLSVSGTILDHDSLENQGWEMLQNAQNVSQ